MSLCRAQGSHPWGLASTCWLPRTVLEAPRAPLFQLGAQVPICPSPLPMSFPSSSLSALNSSSGVPVDWKGRGTLEVGSPVLPQAAGAASTPPLSSEGRGPGWSAGLREWGSLSQRAMWMGGADFSRRESVTPAPGTHPRTVPTCSTLSHSLHFE